MRRHRLSFDSEDKNNKSAMDYYEPNYFTAGALSYLERVMAAYKRIEP